ncbi:MAG TPA: hypothetical protein VG148_10425 [Pyrinomonadaceae bacterium]|nr:hypothetical protein [Pyrinomonadaceae bacterium]
MRPMLDDIELPQVQEIATLERRVLAEHKPPGMSGSLLQDMGRRPARLTLWGVATGPEARAFVEKLDEKFRAAAPVPFVGDIVADADIERVVIENLRVQDLAGKPERFAYVLTLREFVEPVAAEDLSPLDESIAGDALGLMDNLVNGFEIVERLSAFVGRLTELNEALRRLANQP